ncbi:hypothetical protein CN643_11255 [Parageobacillus yumthangensis]|nr:hypothetical protein CN643_11255 [Parageobacillus yumthangensis]
MTNTRQRCGRVVKGDGDKKEGNKKAALAMTEFYLWRCSVGQGFASPNPAGVLFNGLRRTKKSGRLLLEKRLCHGDQLREEGERWNLRQEA